MLYHIWLEDRNRDAVRRLVGSKFDGYSIIEGEGWWKGTREKAICIVFATTAEPDGGWPWLRSEVLALAEELRYVLNQDAVLVQEIHAHGMLVEGPKGMSKAGKAADTEQSDREYILAQQRKRGS